MSYKRPAKKLKKGFVEAALGILSGIGLTILINALANNNFLPRYVILIFGVINIIASILTINSCRFWGTVYTIGWIIGSYLFKDLLEPFDIVVNIITPAIFLALRLILWIKKTVTSF